METATRTFKDETATYRLTGNTIESPDGEGGWYTVDDDSPSDISGFESRCDFHSEELRILMAEATAEFGGVS